MIFIFILCLIFKSYSFKEVINLCDNYDKELVFNASSDSICIICADYQDMNENFTFYIKQTDVLSDIKLEINEFNNISFISAIIELKDVINNISYAYNNITHVINQEMVFNSHWIEVSLKLSQNLSSDFVNRTEELDYIICLSYTEMIFNSTQQYMDADNNSTDFKFSFDYKPNSVQTLILKRTKPKSYGLIIKVNHLDIDINSGDYVIIGTDLSPRSWYSSKSQIITSNKKQRSIAMNTSLAFIQLITHGSLKTGTALEIKWTPEEKFLVDNDEYEISLRLRVQSIPLCIQSKKCNITGFFEDLSAYIAHYINGVIFEGYIDSKFVDNNSVIIFDGVEKVRNSITYCSTRLSISEYKNTDIPRFSHNTLYDILFANNKYFIFNYLNEQIIITNCINNGILIRELCETVVYITIPLIIIITILWKLNKNKAIKTDTINNLRRVGGSFIKELRFKTIKDSPQLRSHTKGEENVLFENKFEDKHILKEHKNTMDGKVETTILECDDMEVIDLKPKFPKRQSIIS